MSVDRESLIGRLHTGLPRSALVSLYVVAVQGAYYLPYSIFNLASRLLRDGIHPWLAYAAVIGWAVWFWLFFLTLRGKFLPPILLLIYAMMQAVFFIYRARYSHWIFWPELTFRLVTAFALIIVIRNRRQIQMCTKTAEST